MTARPFLLQPNRGDRTLYGWPLRALWIAALLALPVWISLDTSGWDVAVYARAIHALKAGLDPYAAAMAVQTAVHQNGGVAAHTDPPYSYVYSPLTLPALRVIASLPIALSGALYWALYAAAVLAQIWVCVRAAEPDERRTVAYLAPLIPFFPGLLANGILLGGNVAYILYAAVLLAAVYAWSGRSWRWFYLAVVAASCVKAPLLSLAVLPVLTARRQWWQASSAMAIGGALFLLQSALWPELFRHYLQAVNLQFAYNRDFGCSPAGLFSGWLYDHGIPYMPAGLLFYAAYALPVLGLLFYLSRQYLAGSFNLRQWTPVLMVGVILLNPRLIEYDVAPLTLPLAFLAWRSTRAFLNRRAAVCVLTALFLVLNALSLWSWSLRKLLDGPLLILLFAAGSVHLVHLARRSRSQRHNQDGSLRAAEIRYAS